MAAMFLFQTLQICALEKSAFRYCFLRKSLWIIYLKDVFFFTDSKRLYFYHLVLDMPICHF